MSGSAESRTTRSREASRFPLALVLLVLLSLLAGATAGFGQTARQAAGDQLARTRAAKTQAQRLTTHADYQLVMQRRGALAEKLASGERFLGFAQGAFDRATSDRNYADATTLASKAQEHFEDFIRSVSAEIEAIDKERNPPPPPPPPPPPAPEPEPDPKATADTSTAVDTAADEVVSEAATKPKTETEPPPSSPPPPAVKPSGRPPKALRDAAQAFLAGNYQRTVDILVSTSYGQKSIQAHVLMLRAAARYNLFLIDGEKEYSLRSQALEDIEACRLADPDLKPVAEIFSPRFRDFFAGIQ